MNDANALNFSGGPGALPASVLRQLQQAIQALPETGLSVLGMSHRSPWFRAVLDEAEENLRLLLQVPADMRLLFLQGGGSLQFSMLPMNFLRGRSGPADYIVSGYWSAKAPIEAAKEGNVRIVWDGRPEGCHRLPAPDELRLSPDAAYLHYASNETVEGLQFQNIPRQAGVPLFCDMSSDLLSAPVDLSHYDAIYAHAQKNLGPAGVTLVILRDGLMQTATDDLPSLLDYRRHAEARSLYNTPPVFAIYALLLVTRWLKDEIGGLPAMAAINDAKARLLYGCLDATPGLYRGWAEPSARSKMNAAFTLPSPALEAAFLAEAKAAGFHGLEGHRSLGGVRVSLYNAVSVQAVRQLTDWMAGFARRHG